MSPERAPTPLGSGRPGGGDESYAGASIAAVRRGRGSSGAWTGHAGPRIQTVQNEGAPPSEKNGPGGIRTLDSRIRNPEPYPC